MSPSSLRRRQHRQMVISSPRMAAGFATGGTMTTMPGAKSSPRQSRPRRLCVVCGRRFFVGPPPFCSKSCQADAARTAPDRLSDDVRTQGHQETPSFRPVTRAKRGGSAPDAPGSAANPVNARPGAAKRDPKQPAASDIARSNASAKRGAAKRTKIRRGQQPPGIVSPTIVHVLANGEVTGLVRLHRVNSFALRRTSGPLVCCRAVSPWQLLDTSSGSPGAGKGRMASTSARCTRRYLTTLLAAAVRRSYRGAESRRIAGGIDGACFSTTQSSNATIERGHQRQDRWIRHRSPELHRVAGLTTRAALRECSTAIAARMLHRLRLPLHPRSAWLACCVQG